MLKRSLPICIFLLLPVLLHGQSMLEITVDAGYSATLYKVADGKRLGGVGYGADLGYSYFFHKNVGIGVGVGFRHYAGGAQLNTLLDYPDVIDTDKEPYEHWTYLHNWREKQDLYYVEIPLSLQFRVPLHKINLWFALGAKYNIAVAGHTAAQGDITHRGYYEKWDLTMDIPAHGFYETSDFRPSMSLRPKNTVALFARMDVGIPLTEHWQILIGVNAHYCLMPAYVLDGKDDLGFRNDKAGWADAHYFMTDYSSLLHTPVLSGKANPLSVGLEVGVRYIFNKREKSYPCHCVNDRISWFQPRR